MGLSQAQTASEMINTKIINGVLMALQPLIKVYSKKEKNQAMPPRLQPFRHTASSGSFPSPKDDRITL